jgi:FMN-dependent oxidoreductase (nitrilotriacetate monooxygenase family)
MHIITQLPGGQGLEPGGWRWPAQDKAAWLDENGYVKAAQLAEQGKLDGFFIPDIPGITTDISRQPPHHGLDPIVLMALMAKATERLGLITTLSTSLNEPYTIARMLRSLDLVSKGRMGWNVVTTNVPDAQLNYFPGILDHAHKHARALEVWEAVLRLWGSWPEGALKLDVEAGVFADTSLIQPINFKGQYVTTRGPINMPPSPQGQPPVFTAGGGQYGYEFATTRANAMYSNPPTLAYAQRFWQQLSADIRQAGRNPDEFTIFNGIGVSIASSEREALQRRAALDELGDPASRQQYLGHMLGIPVAELPLDALIPAALMQRARPSRQDQRAQYAYDLALQGFTIREVLAHGPINYHPIFLGTPEQVADKFQQWFEAGVGKGFCVVPDSGLESLTDFVEQVVPILQKRGLLRTEYTGTTLREHLGLPYQNGLPAHQAASAALTR